MGSTIINLDDDVYRSLSDIAAKSTELLAAAWKYEISKDDLKELFDEVERLREAVNKEK
jgi:ubiquinone biosynthesis protein UbiJ